MISVYALIILLSSSLLVGCTDRNHDPRLEHIAGIASDSPDEALSLLDSIDYDSLSSVDRHFFDLLSIKARDKAYIRHTSDSLMLDIIDYYESHDRDKIYPEALYYGGRVYSDMGDLPSALSYFHDALDALPEDDGDEDLRSCILSQTGRLLNKLRLYKEAAPYIEKAIRLSRSMNDTLNEAYDLQLLGTVYMRAKDFRRADSCFHSALRKSTELPAGHRAKSSMYIAQVKYRMGQIDSALMYVRHTPDLVDSISRNTALATAADIYYAAGILDTAYMYAVDLVHAADMTNKKTGYSILLTPELRGWSHPDSVYRYLSEYLRIQEKYYNESENIRAIMQDTLHNYNIHEKARLQAERSRNQTIIWCWVAIVLILLLLTVLLAFRIRSKQTIIRLHETIARLDIIQHMTNDASSISNKESATICGDTRPSIATDDTIPICPEVPSLIDISESISSDTKTLKELLRKKIALIDTSVPDKPIPDSIINSNAFRTLKKYAGENKFIPESDPLWDELHTLIFRSNPDFEARLYALTGGNIKQHELHTIILIRCGITPTQMTFILGKTKGSISSRRETIGFKLLGTKTSAKTTDFIIRSL